MYLKIPQKVALAQYLLVRAHIQIYTFLRVSLISPFCKNVRCVLMKCCCEQWVFLPDAEQRSQLVLPPPAHVDYRAACFCHRNLIEIGYVCSVCLSSKFWFPVKIHKYILWAKVKVFVVTFSSVFSWSILQLQPHLYNLRVSI